MLSGVVQVIGERALAPDIHQLEGAAVVSTLQLKKQALGVIQGVQGYSTPDH